MSDEAARRRHYGRFYGELDEAVDGRPVGVVAGNCQAESLRLALGDEVDLVRTPPVHELVADDLPHLRRWLARSGVLITQPIHDDYHGLPLGSRQLAAALGAGAAVCRIPVVRFAGLYPFHAIVRPPSDTSLVPPLVAYHDLRLLGRAAGLEVPATATPEAVRAVAAESLDQLRRREEAHATVRIADLFERPTFDHMRTLNHPGNPVWVALAGRVAQALGLERIPPAPSRPLLTSVHAPREAAVIETWGLPDEPTDHWVVDGVVIEGEAVRAEHLAWYGRHPEVVRAGLDRHAAVLELLGAR
ncbi:peptide ABC transporter ATPase [Serinibacter arcticus]|uniref:Peptide ABC transporter ATPase n=1 Tax=Serinibacter arcticus TaxID=1655435 RepID=A0A2U1ZSL9_9MICO|nr:WcbI family polysaccharide biosynthesis putative acetyltransferase [Serinibacter arcticus]PWD49933.1 peptide ABC transporter ATPase [Serinibacter arcticus]